MALNRVAGWLSLLTFLSEITARSNRRCAVGQRTALRQAQQVMLFSGLAGFFLGLSSQWQIAVESAQALAGIVSYPIDNPFYMYHLKSWTLLHQIPAALLACGMSERSLSLLLAGLTGSISFQAIALCCFVFSRDRLLACVTPLACEVTNACRDLESVHQIRLLPEEHWSIYGVFGLAYVLYSWSLLAAGLRRTSAFLFALGPAVHPTLGAWGLFIGAPVLARRWRREPQLVRGELAALGCGAALTVLSLGAQLFLARHVPSADPELARRLVTAFAHGWDNHRVAVSLLHPVIVAVACTIALCLVWLKFNDDRSDASRELLRCLAASALLSLALAISTQCQAWLPFTYLMAMPGRFNDVIAIAFPALTLGLLARHRGRLLLQAVLCLALIYLVVKAVMMTTHRIYIPATTKVLPAAGLALLLAAPQLTGAQRGGRGGRVFWRLVRWLAAAGMGAAAFACRSDRRVVIAIAAVAAVLWLLSGSHRLWEAVEARLQPWQSLRRALHAVNFACLATLASIVVGPWLALGLFAGGLFLTRGEWLAACQPFASSGGRGSRCAAVVLAAAAVVLGGVAFDGQIREGQARLPNWQNDDVFAALSRGQGLILAGGRIPLIQLQCRRGVLMYGAAINQITYVPDSAPKINEILQQIYDEDLTRPRPFDWDRCGGLMYDSARETWESRSLQEWQELACRFGFTDVVANARWTLQLPRIAANRRYAAFHIPAGESAPPEDGEEAPHSLARLSSRSDSTTAETSLPRVGE